MRQSPQISATPRSIEDALKWQTKRLGSFAWEGWALKFQRMAFGYVEDSGWADAQGAFEWIGNHGLITPGPVPRGGLAWFTLRDRTTVLCGFGQGQVIGPGIRGAVGLADHTRLAGYQGWSPAHFPFAR